MAIHKSPFNISCYEGAKPLMPIMILRKNAIFNANPTKAILFNFSLFFRFKIKTNMPNIIPTKKPIGNKKKIIKSNKPDCKACKLRK